MKARAFLRMMLTMCLLLIIAVPASADVWLPSGLIVIEDQAFMCAAYLSGSCDIPQGVTTIGAQAFYGCSGITSVTIPDSVTYIGSQAFAGCTGLTGTLVLPEGVTVAEDAFENCPNLTIGTPTPTPAASELFSWTVKDGAVTITGYIGDDSITDVEIPETIDDLPVTAIASRAFSGVKTLRSIRLPQTLVTISERAFYRCTSLESISIPDSVRSIGSRAFYGCSSLNGTLHLVDASVGSFALTGSRLTALNYTSRNGELTLSSSSGMRSEANIPASLCGMPVTAIDSEVFAFCTSLSSVTIPSSVTSIGQGAFYYCTGLTSLVVPEGVKTIGGNAFRFCSSLTSLSLPQTLESVGIMAFCDCKCLTGTVYLTDVDVSYAAFSNCGDLSMMSFTRSSDALTLCSCSSDNASISVPATLAGVPVTGLTAHAFSSCANLTAITLPDTLTAICSEAFRQCTKLESVNIPASVTTIGDSAFYGCTALKSILLPASVSTVSERAFYKCTALSSLTISSSDTQVGAYAFNSCTALANVSLPAGFDNFGNLSMTDTPWLTAQVQALTDEITAGCSSAYERVLAIHDWIIYNTAYDESYTHYGVEGILFHGIGVCNSYAQTCHMMLDAANVQNITISGTATDAGTGNTGSHAWNLVYLTDGWYHVDTTWDDPIPNGHERYVYFCINDEQMSKDHQWNTGSTPAANGTLYLTNTAVMTLNDDEDASSSDSSSDSSEDDRIQDGKWWPEWLDDLFETLLNNSGDDKRNDNHNHNNDHHNNNRPNNHYNNFSDYDWSDWFGR